MARKVPPKYWEKHCGLHCRICSVAAALEHLTHASFILFLTAGSEEEVQDVREHSV